MLSFMKPIWPWQIRSEEALDSKEITGFHLGADPAGLAG